MLWSFLSSLSTAGVAGLPDTSIEVVELGIRFSVQKMCETLYWCFKMTTIWGSFVVGFRNFCVVAGGGLVRWFNAGCVAAGG